MFSAVKVGLTDNARSHEEVAKRPSHLQLNRSIAKSAPQSAPKATPSSSLAWDYSQVDMLGM